MSLKDKCLGVINKIIISRETFQIKKKILWQTLNSVSESLRKTSCCTVGRFLFKDSNINIWLLPAPVCTKYSHFQKTCFCALCPSQSYPWWLSQQGDFLPVLLQPCGFRTPCVPQCSPSPLQRERKWTRILPNLRLQSLFSLFFFKPITPFFRWYFFNVNFLFTLLSAWKACETFPGTELS